MPFHGKYGIDLHSQITSPLTDSGKQGVAYSYQMTATNSPSGFGANGLPSGLSVDPGTGLISGTPTVSGVFEIMLNASNGLGFGPVVILTLTLAVGTNFSKTTVHNTGETRFIGYLPPHGRVMASGDQITLNGDLRTVLACGPCKRYSGRTTLDALDVDIQNGDIVLVQAGS